MRKIALAAVLALASTPATAGGTSWTDGGGTTYYNGDSYAGTSYTDSTGQTHYSNSQGQGKAWTDGGGVTHYEGTTPYSGYRGLYDR